MQEFRIEKETGELLQRRNLYKEDPTYIYSVEYIKEHIEVKGKIVDRMAELDPHPFWTENRNAIISESILIKNGINTGSEYKLKTLKLMLKKLTNNPTGSEFERLSKIRDQFQLFKDWNLVDVD